MKEGWEKRRLGEACLIKPPKKEAREKAKASTLVSFLPMEDLGIGIKLVKPSQTRQLSAAAGSYTYFADGDILLAKITPCFENGKLGIANELSNGIGFGSSEYIVLRPSAMVTKEWVYYFLSRKQFREEGAAQMTGAVGHKRIPKEFVEDYPLPVPPIDEQHRIVAVLDNAFADLDTAKANAERNLHNAKALYDCHLEAVFAKRDEGWAEHVLGELIEIQNGYAFKSNEYTDSGSFLIRISNVQDGKISLINPRYVRLTDQRLERFALKEGDILISLTGNIGRAGIIQMEHLPAALNQRVARVTVKSQNIDRDFLFRFLSSRTFRANLQDAGHGAAQQNVSTKEIESVLLSVPNKTEQRATVEEFNRFDEEVGRLTHIYERKLAALEELKTSLLHQAFNGEL